MPLELVRVELPVGAHVSYLLQVTPLSVSRYG
jgi:hypothetical protein